METIEIFDIAFKLLLIFILPIAFLVKQKALYFEIKGFNIPAIFNVFASVIGTLVIIVYYFKPPYDLEAVWNSVSLTTLLIWVCIIITTYFIVLIRCRNWLTDESSKELESEVLRLSSMGKDANEEDPVLLNLKERILNIRLVLFFHFVLYMVLFIIIAMILVKSKLYIANKVISGRIIDADVKGDIRNAWVKGFVKNSVILTKSDFEGKFKLIVEKEDLLDSVEITSPGYEAAKIRINSNGSLYRLLNEIHLQKKGD